MTTCTECGQSSGHRLCQECLLERDDEYHRKKAEEMRDRDGAGEVRTGPDAEDVTIVGGGDDA